MSVTIFESAAGGLFIPAEASVRPGNFVSLPNQNVDTKGNISVPYAGAIRAAGRTPSEVQESIVDALARRRELHCKADDILDALVALWTAERIARGSAISIPAQPPLDAYGLRMEMVA